jgi:predicted protein tyrosine phosphatase
MDSDDESSDNDNYYVTGLISRITEKLYLTDVYGASNEKNLKELGIVRIISIGNWSEQMRYKKFEGIDYLPIILDDWEEEDISIFFSSSNDFICDSPGPVLVHCWAGISRSTAIVIAHLMMSKKKSYLGAFLSVRTMRPFIRPNIGFIDALGKLERK